MRSRAFVLCAVTASVVLVGGCGDLDASSSTPPRSADDVQRQLNELRDTVLGSAVVRQSLAVTDYLDYSAVMASCMEEHGQPFRQGPLVVNDIPGPTDWVLPVSPVADEWVGQYGLSVGSGYSTRPWPIPFDPSSVETDASDEMIAAQTECEEKNPPRSDGGWPAAALELKDELRDLTIEATETDEIQGLMDAYPRCMRDSGYDIEERSDLIAIVSNRYGEIYFNGKDADPRLSDAWQDVVQYELETAAADSQCRTEMYSLTMSRLDRNLQAYAADHANDLTEVQQVYAQLVSDAQARAAAAGLNVDWRAAGETLQPIR